MKYFPALFAWDVKLDRYYFMKLIFSVYINERKHHYKKGPAK